MIFYITYINENKNLTVGFVTSDTNNYSKPVMSVILEIKEKEH